MNSKDLQFAWTFLQLSRIYHWYSARRQGTYLLQERSSLYIFVLKLWHSNIHCQHSTVVSMLLALLLFGTTELSSLKSCRSWLFFPSSQVHCWQSYANESLAKTKTMTVWLWQVPSTLKMLASKNRYDRTLASGELSLNTSCNIASHLCTSKSQSACDDNTQKNDDLITFQICLNICGCINVLFAMLTFNVLKLWIYYQVHAWRIGCSVMQLLTAREIET